LRHIVIFLHEEADMPKDALELPELEATVERFRSLLDADAIDAAQDHSPASVYTPFVTVCLMVHQRLRGNASLEEAVVLWKQQCAAVPAHPRRRLSANSGAYSRARTRLDLELAENVADHVFQTLVSATPPSCAGRRVFLVDGTTFSLASEEALRAIYPPASNQHGQSVWPILHAAVAHELSSGCAVLPEIGAMYGPDAVSEVTLATRLLLRLPARSILLADRAFGIFAFAFAARQAGHDVITRLTQSRFGALKRRAALVGPGRWELDWTPTKADRTSHPDLPADASLRVQLSEAEGTDAQGQPTKLWFMTTLRETDLTGPEVADIYRQRLHVETDIRDVKVALKMNELRGRSDPMLRKELALGMVAYNLVIQIRRLAAKKAGVAPRRLSFKGAWSLVQPLLLPNNWTPRQYMAQFEETLRGCIERALPKRPGRSYPRKLLRRGTKYPVHPLKKHEPPTK
jgi:hypothetical protein